MTTETTPSMTREQFLGIAAAIATISAVGTSISLGLPLLAILMEERGISAFAIGVSSAMAGVASLVTTPFVTPLAERVGPTRLLAASVIIATLVFPLYYVFDNYWIWLILRFAFHGSINTAFILSEFWINSLAPPAKRGLFMGIYGTVLSIGFAVGPVIFGLLGSQGPAPFIAGTAVMALSIIPVIMALGVTPSMEEKSGHSFFRFLTLVPLSTFAALAMGAAESGMMSFIAIYGLRLGYTEQLAALLVTAMAVGNILSQLPLGIISDRMDRRKLLFIIATLGAGFAALIPFVSGHMIILMLVVGAFGGVGAGLYTVGLTHLGARMKGADLASANAAFIFMYAIGMLIGPASMGIGMEIWNPYGLAVVASIIVGSYAILAFIRLKMVPKPAAIAE